MSEIRDGAKIVVSPEQVSCALDRDAKILNLKNGTYYGLNAVAARVWNLLQEPRTFGELRDILAVEYDVDVAELESDIRELLEDLEQNELVYIG